MKADASHNHQAKRFGLRVVFFLLVFFFAVAGLFVYFFPPLKLFSYHGRRFQHLNARREAKAPSQGGNMPPESREQSENKSSEGLF